jgi:ribonuclease HII
MNQMLLERFNSDKSSWEIGVDEVGRGCLLGPVVAAAVALPPHSGVLEHQDTWSEVRDSKKLSASKRKRLCEFILSHVSSHGVAFVSETDIDKTNILIATMQAMNCAIQKCLDGLDNDSREINILVDGNRFTPTITTQPNTRFHCVIGGDDKYLAIAAASILAKESRDAYVSNLVLQYPELNEKYELLKNKGYGTKAHMDGLVKHGATEFHRKTFKPISTFKD